jgi:hypothetical protein
MSQTLLQDSPQQGLGGNQSNVQEIMGKVGNIADDGANLPNSGTVRAAEINVNPWELQGQQQAGATNVANAQQAATTTAAAPTQANAQTMQATQVGQNTPQMQAAQGTVDPRSQVEAQQAEVDERSTVQGQLKSLMDGDQRWAQGAVRRANEAMAARGMGSSTLAGEAITNAVIESALPIAQADAGIFAQFQLANLNNRQQAALANAQKVHEVNMANLSNDQQSRLVNTQAKLQTLLSDQSADNAAKQFNAANQTQVDMFMSQLGSQVEQFNAAQANALSQFNAGQTNAMSQLKATLDAQREQFNTQMRAQIDQSNVTWRRAVNTANTAAQNEANKINAQNSLNLSNWALNSVWQQFRDEADYAFTSSENAKNRATQMAILSSQQAFQQGLFDQNTQNQMYQALGSFAATTLGNLIKK